MARAGGFSLIEMLVALAIFGLAVLGLLNLAGESTRTAWAIEERVLAGVVADNVAVDAMLVDIARLDDTATGDASLGGHAWRWTRTVSATAEPDMLRIDVAVHPAADDRVAAELSLFRNGAR